MALDLDFRLEASQPWYVFPVLTSAVFKIGLPSAMIEIKHLGYQDDAFATPSVAGDAVICMEEITTMVATLATGKKLPLQPGESWLFDANFIATGNDAPHEIHLKAVGNAARMLIVMGRQRFHLR